MEVQDMIEIGVIVFVFIVICLLLKKKKVILIVIVLSLVNIFLIGHLSYGTIIEKPVITMNGVENIEIEVGNIYIDSGVNVLYRGKDITNKVRVSNTVDTAKIGEYLVTYILQNKKESIILERKIKVVDKVAPIITLKGKKEISIPADSKYIEDGYTAQDNYDGDITNKVVIDKEEINHKEYRLHYTIEDTSHNSFSITRIIHIKDPVRQENANKNGVIYLTFDDGPSLDVTPKVLDILKQENIKATFFILNYDNNREFLVKRIVTEGHSIGIHGYSHEYSKIYQSTDTYMENIIKLEQKILKTTGVDTKLTRFPGGSSNTISKSYTIGIMSKLTSVLLNKGYFYYDWNVSSGDAGDVKTKEGVYQNVISGLSKKRCNMVLMHDFSKNNKTLDALRDIIRYGKENGYTFECINSKTTPMVTHKVAN